MEHTYWVKQTAAKPLFPDLQWSRPENKIHAGKLLVIGGNAQGFAAAAEAYAQAGRAGIGTARVLLPNSLQKTVGKIFEAGEYAPSTPSGSFAQAALADFIDFASWSDGVLLAGNFGRNSETAILLEYFAEKYSGQLTYTKDAAEYVITAPGPLLMREQTLLVLSFSQLQKLAIGARYTRAFTTDMDLLHLLDALHEFTIRYKINLITRHNGTVIVASEGKISTTKQVEPAKLWCASTAAHASTWWLQNPTRTFEALTTAAYELSN